MGRTAQRRQANSANRRIARLSATEWFYGQSFNGGTRGDAPKEPLLTCSACGRQVFTLCEGECLRCHAPAEGKNSRDMTAKQATERHSCGVLNRQHCDGWDGNWLPCEEVKHWRQSETFEQMDARIAADVRRDERDHD